MKTFKQFASILWMSLVLWGFVFIGFSNAAVYYVSPSGDDSDGSTWAKAKNKAKDLTPGAGGGHTVYIAPGTYTTDHIDPQASANWDNTQWVGTAAHGSTVEGSAADHILSDDYQFILRAGIGTVAKHLTLIATNASNYCLTVAVGKDLTATDIVVKDSARGVSVAGGTLTITGFAMTDITSFGFLAGGGTTTLSSVTSNGNLGYNYYIYGTAIFTITDSVIGVGTSVASQAISQPVFYIDYGTTTVIKRNVFNANIATVDKDVINLKGSATAATSLTVGGTSSADKNTFNTYSANQSVIKAVQAKTATILIRNNDFVHTGTIGLAGGDIYISDNIGTTTIQDNSINQAFTGVNVIAYYGIYVSPTGASTMGVVSIERNSVITNLSVGGGVIAGDEHVTPNTIKNKMNNGIIAYNTIACAVGNSPCHNILANYQTGWVIKYNYVTGGGYGAVVKGYTGANLATEGIHHNVFGDAWYHTLQLSDMPGINVVNNTFFQNAACSSSYSFYVHDTGLAINAGIVFKNNVFGPSVSNKRGVGLDSADISILISDYNNFYLAGASTEYYGVAGAATYATWAAWQATGQDAHSIATDPLFISASDFRLQPASPAVRSGTFISGIHDQPGCKDLAGLDCNSMAIPSGAYSTVSAQPTLRY